MKLSNGVVFQNRQEDLYDSNEFITELEKYIEPTDELSAVLLENGQLKAVSQSTLWYGFNGLNVKLFLSEWRDKLAELKQFRKDTYTDKFTNGKTITISRSYGDHRFTDKELNDLYAGKEIEITFNTQWGNTRTVTGKIEKKDWPEKEIIFWGFITHSLEDTESIFVEGIYKGQQIKFKNSFSDHKYTEEEIENLLKGNAIYVIYTGSKGPAAARIKLVQYQNDYYKAQPEFDTPPVFWFGHEFTIKEIEQLHMGNILEHAQLISSKGNIYVADLRWHDGRLQRRGKDGVWK